MLASFPAPRPTTNPYIVMLAESLRAAPGVELREFSWRAALVGSFDVFHVHWPELLLWGPTRLKTAARLALTVVLLAKLRITRTPVVRTAHNVDAHEELSWLKRRLLAYLDRHTAVWIAINEETPLPPGRERRTILHGHYRGWFEKFGRPATVPGRLAYFGQIRPYKNVDGLLRAFRETRDPTLTLEIAGAPAPALRPVIEALAGEDPRVRGSLRYVEDEEIARLVGEAELVVLPYRDMLNSGGLLLALSLDRPVLVPSTPANERIAAEVGEEWVLRYDGDLTPAVLTEGLAAARAATRAGQPDLSRREWDAAGADHVAAYRWAIARTRRRRGVR